MEFKNMWVVVRLKCFFLFRYPNLKTIRDLVYKRGFAKAQGRRMPLSDNALIEKALGAWKYERIKELSSDQFNWVFRVDCRKVRNDLHWRFNPRNLHCWSPLQAGHELLVAFQAEQPYRRMEKEDDSLCGRWRLWQPRRQIEHSVAKNDLRILHLFPSSYIAVLFLAKKTCLIHCCNTSSRETLNIIVVVDLRSE